MALVFVLNQEAKKQDTRREVLKAMRIQVAFFWVVTPCSDVAGYQCFGRLAASIFGLKMEAARSSLYDVTTQKTAIFKKQPAMQ
jgi:hypothetical protein